MISPDEAWQRLAAGLAPLDAESASRQASLGRVLAEPLAATVDVPGLDVSAMDGYAVAGAPAAGDSLPVAGTVAAGDPPGDQLAPGQALRIMTGAPVPRGADTVVPVERTDGGVERVRFLQAAEPGRHIRRRGEIVSAGQPLLAAGRLLTPEALALLAAHGIAEVKVHRRPRVAVLTTGDEVVPPEVEPAPGQLRDSHTDFLRAACRSLGLEARPLGIAGDRLEELAAGVADGLADDVLLVCGGVSMGEFDFVAQVLAEAGCEMLFDAVALQPGKPLVAARRGERRVFGLPGNPGSVMVCFWLFVRPLLRRLQGLDDGFWHGALAATLAAPLPGSKDRDRFLPAELEVAGGELTARPVAPRGSHDLAASARGTALVRVTAGAAPRAAGERCEVLPIWSS